MKAAAPVLFLSHGAPPLADDVRWTGELADWGGSLPRPSTILVVSAHWEAAPITLSASDWPRCATQASSSSARASRRTTSRGSTPTPGPDTPAPRASSEFDDWAARAVTGADVDTLLDARRTAPAFDEAHPRSEHWAPLYLSLGAALGQGSGYDVHDGRRLLVRAEQALLAVLVSPVVLVGGFNVRRLAPRSARPCKSAYLFAAALERRAPDLHRCRRCRSWNPKRYADLHARTRREAPHALGRGAAGALFSAGRGSRGR